MAEAVNITITAQNQWSAPIPVRETFDLSIDMNGASLTVTVQRRDLTRTDVWHDVASFSSSVQKTGTVGTQNARQYRVGCKTGNYTSGTAYAEISQ